MVYKAYTLLGDPFPQQEVEGADSDDRRGRVTNSLFEASDTAAIEVFQSRMNAKLMTVVSDNRAAILSSADPMEAYVDVVAQNFL